MKPTVSGTDDQEHRHDSQTSTSSEAKIDVGAVTVPRRHITYTTAQLHERLIKQGLVVLASALLFHIKFLKIWALSALLHTLKFCKITLGL